AHQDCPFEKVVEALNPDRTLGHNPIYNVGLLMQNFPRQPAFGHGLQAQAFPLETPSALLDLRWIADETLDGLALHCEYNTDLFGSETVERLVQAYCQTLEHLAAQPETRLENFALPAELVEQAR